MIIQNRTCSAALLLTNKMQCSPLSSERGLRRFRDSMMVQAFSLQQKACRLHRCVMCINQCGFLLISVPMPCPKPNKTTSTVGGRLNLVFYEGGKKIFTLFLSMLHSLSKKTKGTDSENVSGFCTF